MPQPLVAVDLTPATARLWVEAGPPVPDAAEAEAQVKAFLEAGHPGALVAVLEGDRPLARLQASPVGSCGIGLFAVGFREGLGDATAEEAGRVMLTRTLALTRDFPATRYVETDVPSAYPFPAGWRRALEAQGLAVVAEAYTFERALGGERMPDGLTLHPVDALPPEVVTGVYEGAYLDSDDVSHRESPEPFAVRYERLKTIPLLAPDFSSWFVAMEGDRPLGLVFASLEQEPYGSPTTGWIVEIGVLPEGRGRGLGARLLQAGLAALAARGATQVLSRIDVHNAPSVKIHLTAGFTRRPEPSWLHRKLVGVRGVTGAS